MTLGWRSAAMSDASFCRLHSTGLESVMACTGDAKISLFHCSCSRSLIGGTQPVPGWRALCPRRLGQTQCTVFH